MISLGLDISDYKLRLVALKYGYRKPELSAFSEVELTPGVLVNGSIQQPEQLIIALKQLLKHIKGRYIHERNVKVGLPEQHSFITTIPADDLSKEQLTQEALHHIPFKESEMYYDIQVNRAHHIATIAAGRNAFIDTYLTLLEAADFHSIGLYVEAYAMTKALCNNHVTGGAMIIDLGLARTTITFYLNQTVYFTTSYPSVIATQGVNETNLAGVITQMVSYYQEHFQKITQLQNIYLCGSGAYMPNITNLIAKYSAISTKLGDPFITLRSKRFYNKLPNPLAYTTAIGLALLS
ncbi:MAG: pilus assembly protein PilM [Patescibacteria group bacterium]|jgi:Tfp pilus assembly PilM family ATPase